MVSLKESAGLVKDQIGGKAYWLGKMLAHHINIPKGYVLLKEAFEQYLVHNKISIGKKDDEKLFYYDEIRELIFKGQFTQTLLSELEACYESLEKPIIVRSSASMEDGDLSSCAGLFQSIGEVDSFDKMLEAIKLCWISIFSDLIDVALGPDWDHSISVVIQEQKIPQYGGVAFTADPITHNREKFIIELSEAGCKAVVTGSSNVTRILLDRDGPAPEGIYKSGLEMLRKQLLEIEALLDAPVDVEWLVCDDTLYIIQARKITTYKEQPKKSFIEVEDPDILKYDLANCISMHSRWLEKKIPVQRFCIQNGINVGKFYYFFKRDAKEGNIHELLKHITSEMVELHDGKHIRLVKRDEVLSVIQNEYPTSTVIRIGESIPTEFCGFSAAVNGNLYVEAVMGGFTGFYEGGYTPSIYVLDRSCNILSESIAEFTEEYYLKDTWWEKRAISPVKLMLNASQLQAIVEMTTKLNEKFGEVRVEWIANSTGIYLFDLSVEKVAIGNTQCNGQILSDGTGEGIIQVLEDINIFDDHVKEISIRMGHELYKLSSSESITKIKTDMGLYDNSVILVCEYPKEHLAVLVDSVKGFIFERGSLLCHLSIILRERKIPAIIIPNIKTMVSNGQKARIENGELSLITKG